ncbi:hypothetical protein PCURB6_41660 [Paenibacillus curdlanolyticus]|nr:hypothetical protein PCURB6_41660 [Paenibacillus curdlanolyticus]
MKAAAAVTAEASVSMTVLTDDLELHALEKIKQSYDKSCQNDPVDECESSR